MASCFARFDHTFRRSWTCRERIDIQHPAKRAARRKVRCALANDARFKIAEGFTAASSNDQRTITRKTCSAINNRTYHSPPPIKVVGANAMAVELEGGCRVSAMNEGTPEIVGNVKLWRQIGTSTGAKAVSLRIMEFDEGRSPLIRNDEVDEVFYYLESFEEDRPTASRCTVQLDGRSFDLEPETGFYLRAGKVLSVLNPSNVPVILVSVQCPKSANNKDATSFPGVRLADRVATPTADRWYRVLVDEEVGSSQVT